MAETLTRGVSKIFNTSLKCLFRTPSIQQPACPYLDTNGCGLWMTLVSNRCKTTSGHVVTSGHKRAVLPKLLEPEQVGKLLKKSKVKSKQINKSGASKRQSSQVYSVTKFPNKTNLTIHKQKGMKTKRNATPNREVTGSFLSSLSKSYALECQRQKLVMDCAKLSSQIAELNGDKRRKFKIVTTGDIESYLAANTMNGTNVSKSGCSDQNVTKQGDPYQVGLEMLHLDVVPRNVDQGQWVPVFKGATGNPSNKMGRMAEQVRTTKDMDAASDSDTSLLGRSQNRIENAGKDIRRSKGEENVLQGEGKYYAGGTSTQQYDLHCGTDHHGSHLNIFDKRASTEHNSGVGNAESKQTSSIQDGTPKSTAFILVDESCQSAVDEQGNTHKTKVTKSFSKKVDKLIQTSLVESWEKKVQKKIVESQKPITSFITNLGGQRNDSGKNVSDSKAGLCDPRDQMENYVFGDKPCEMISQNVSTVPNNSSKLPLRSAYIRELKPETVKETKKTYKTDSRKRSKSEPVLSVLPNEISRKKPKKREISKVYKDSNSLGDSVKDREFNGKRIKNIRPGQLEKKEMGAISHSLPVIGSKAPWSSQLISTVEKAQTPVVVGKKELPEIWSSSEKLLNLKKKKAEIKNQNKGMGSGKTDVKLMGGSNVSSLKSIETKMANVVNKRGSKDDNLIQELRQQFSKEFRENYVQMQKDRLLKMALDSKRSSLVYSPGSQGKWLSELVEKTDVKLKKQQKKRTENASSSYVSSSVDGKALPTKELWQTHGRDEVITGKEVPRLSKMIITKDKIKKNTTGLPVASISKADDDNAYEAFVKDKDALLHDQMIYQLKQQENQNKWMSSGSNMHPLIDRLDGLVTMTLTPIHDAQTPKQPVTGNKRPASKKTKYVERPTSTKTDLPTTEAVLNRYMLALRRYRDKEQKEKEEKKRRRPSNSSNGGKKKRNTHNSNKERPTSKRS